MHIIAGLGNPGEKHAKNRHNAGFMAADAIFRRHSFSPWKRKFRSEICEGAIGGEKVLLMKPQTFMNLSGEAVGEAMRFYKLGPAEITVLYDELDLAPGKVRIRTGGGTGGHNGIKSMDAHCGRDYRRVRIGIGHPGDKARVHGHVLGDFAKADSEWLDPMMDAIGEHIGLLVSGDESTFMNKVALATRPAGKADTGKDGDKPARGKSHVHQARKPEPKGPPAKGPMAEMLNKLFGKK